MPRRWGIKLRSAVLSMVVLTLALAVVAVSLLITVTATLEGAGATEASTRADQIAESLREDSPVELDEILFVSDRNALVSQIVDDSGELVRASPGAPAQPLTEVRPLPGDRVDVGRIELPGDQGDYRVVVRGVLSSTGPLWVISGAYQEPAEGTLRTVALGLGVAFPLIIAIVGAATYFLVGRALRPVESMRRQVAAISSADLADRVPANRSRDEIGRLARTMNDMLARLEAGQATQRAFVGNASHELRSPLSTIITALELARQRPELLDRAMVTGMLLPEAHRMQHLVDDLLLLATADEQGLRPRLVEVDLDDLVDGEIGRQQALVGTAGITITAISPAVRLRADRGQLTRAIRNLLDNAVRCAATTVHVEIHGVDGNAWIAIDDDGPGVPPADRARILERFVRLDDDRARSTGGTGLGLAIVAEIVAAHSGIVTIGTSPLGGAQFVLALPLTGPGEDAPTGGNGP